MVRCQTKSGLRLSLFCETAGQSWTASLEVKTKIHQLPRSSLDIRLNSFFQICVFFCSSIICCISLQTIFNFDRLNECSLGLWWWWCLKSAIFPIFPILGSILSYISRRSLGGLYVSSNNFLGVKHSCILKQVLLDHYCITLPSNHFNFDRLNECSLGLWWCWCLKTAKGIETHPNTSHA